MTIGIVIRSIDGAAKTVLRSCRAILVDELGYREGHADPVEGLTHGVGTKAARRAGKLEWPEYDISGWFKSRRRELRKRKALLRDD